MQHARHHPRSSAFTLIELLAVMAIVLILAGLVLGGINGVKQRANIARAKAELAIIAQALEEYKRHYGDYPQMGPSLANSFRVTLNVQGVSVGPGTTTVQARLLNALIGVYGPTNFAARVNGPTLLDVGRLRLEVPFSSSSQTTSNLMTTFAVPTGSPPTKPVANNALLDPWGNRYMYFYKPTPVAGRPAARWDAPSYILYSVGPDGAATTLPNAQGLFTATTQITGDNADNIYADKN